jgi:hypothetical protein
MENKIENCGCGKEAKYLVKNRGACNKHLRCLTYDDLKAVNISLNHENAEFRIQLETSKAKETESGFIDFSETHLIRKDIVNAKMVRLEVENAQLAEKLKESIAYQETASHNAQVYAKKTCELVVENVRLKGLSETILRELLLHNRKAENYAGYVFTDVIVDVFEKHGVKL